MRGEEPDGDHGMLCASWRQIEKAGDKILRPYVSLGTRRKGEGEGVSVKIVVIFHLPEKKQAVNI